VGDLDKLLAVVTVDLVELFSASYKDEVTPLAYSKNKSFDGRFYNTHVMMFSVPKRIMFSVISFNTQFVRKFYADLSHYSIVLAGEDIQIKKWTCVCLFHTQLRQSTIP
jgi:hypothetical protein